MRFTFFCVVIVLLGCSRTPQAQDQFQTGDIIFQSSKSGQSYAVQLATHSKYSHVGMIVKLGGKTYVYEAVQPVKYTPLLTWIGHGDGRHYVVKRLKPTVHKFQEEDFEKIISAGEKYKGKNYDLYFEWSDEKIYCSELIWKIYREALGIEVGVLQELKSFDLSHPIVQEKVQERYGENIPLNEKVISPGGMFDSDKLYTVTEQ